MRNSEQRSIFIIMLLDTVSFSFIFSLLPFYAQKFGSGALSVGSMSLLFAVCQICMAPVFGHFSDKIGRKPMLLVSQFGLMLGHLLLAFSPSMEWVFVARAISGLSATGFPLAMAYLADVTKPEERVQAFGKVTLAIGVGLAVGPGIAGLLYSEDPSYPAFAAALLCIANMALSSTSLQNHVIPTKTSQGAVYRRYLQILSRAKTRQTLVMLLLFSCATMFYYHGFSMFVNLRLHHDDGTPYGPREVGYLVTYAGCLTIFWQLVLKKLLARFDSQTLIELGLAAGIIGHFAVGFINSPFLFALTAIATNFSAGVLRPSLTGLLSKSVDKSEQGLTMGIFQVINSSAQIIGPILGSYLIHLNATVMWSWTPVYLFLLCWVVLLWKPAPKKSQEKVSEQTAESNEKTAA